MIIRRRYNRNFTVLSNTVFDDDRLSLDALGVLCYLRSRPEDWSVHLQQLGSRFKVGREKMQRITRELIDAGWIQREQSRELGGTFASVEYVVYDEPELGAPQSENPTAAVATSEYLPQSGLPPTVNPTAAYKEETLNTERHKNPLTPKGAASAGRLNSKEWERDAGYQRFLEAYRPSLAWRPRLGYRNWRKLSDNDKAAAIANIAAYRAYCAKEQRKMSDPTAYLEGTFGNFITSSRARAPESPALSALRAARPGEGFLVEFGTPEWLAWQAVADAVGYGYYCADYGGTMRFAFSYRSAADGQVFAVTGTSGVGGAGRVLMGKTADRFELVNVDGAFSIFDRPGLAQMFAVDKGAQLTLGTTIVLKKCLGNAAGFTAGTGTPNKGAFNAATATTAETAARLLALEQALSYHGIIGA